MKKSLNFLSRAAALGLMVGASMTFTGCGNQADEIITDRSELIQNGKNAKSNVIPNSYIVVFKDEVKQDLENMIAAKAGRMENIEHADLFRATKENVDVFVNQMAAKAGISEKTITNRYGHAVCGFSAKLTEAEVQELKQNPNVAYVEPDYVVKLEDVKGDVPTLTTTLNALGTPWGITRVGGFVNMTGSSRWAWVIDSGIDLDHPDLTVNTANSRSFISGTTADDQNGHGTHVAGTIAAKNNTIGVVGVAAGATVVSVKVFGANGESANSIIIAGVDYVTANADPGDVANMSLGGPASTATDDAVKRLAARGVRCAVAAGNESQNALNVSPARANATNIWTVTAFDVNNNFASFSNYSNPGSTSNTPIEVSAPGVSINSCWLNGGYRSISGTSMATPHVAGILLVNNGVIRTSGTVIGDRATPSDPRAVR